VKVSIISPVHNESSYIAEMLASVVAQSHDDFELIVVDDGSTDGTADVVAAVASGDARVQLYRQSQAGKVAAINKGFGRSTGDLVVLLAGDDVLPPNSLRERVDAFASEANASEPAVMFSRLKTFSNDPRFDGMVLPRRKGGNQSGGTTTLSRALASLVFPIDEALVAEDTWIATAATALAAKVIISHDIVLNYRIHAGNSNPRHLPFAQMTESYHHRMAAYPALLAEERLDLGAEWKRRLGALAAAEERRWAERPLAIAATRHLTLTDRLRFISMATPSLYALRSRYYRFFSGW
jgi:glycosyltransferase involved in cell wall biosynthesis